MGFQTGEVFSLFPETVHMSSGATLTVAPLPGQAQIDIKYVGGGR